MKSLARTLTLAACAAVLAAAWSRAQAPGPDAPPPPPDAQAGQPQDGPDGAPHRGAPGAQAMGMCAGPQCGPGGPVLDGPGARRAMNTRWGRGDASPELESKMQKAAEIDGRLWAMIKKLRDANAKDRAAAKPELRKLIAEMFDARVAMAEEEQKVHEKRAAQLKERIAKRKARRDAIIDRKVDQAVGDDDADDWD